jgi:hypothetical protein
MSYSYLSDNRSAFKLKDKYQSAGKSELPGSSENPNDDKNVEKNKSDKQQHDSVNGKIYFSILNFLNLLFLFGTIITNVLPQEKEEKIEDPNELGAKLMRAELMGDEVRLKKDSFLINFPSLN